ncbi:protein arginine N-methyltransferase 9-like [Ornithodoros turicata]|uniref:protein arginine N-methyltransferase 9-like n=1 Tax=Ornithodoros turicata TaxID=34597 RepID=UPI003138C33C
MSRCTTNRDRLLEYSLQQITTCLRSEEYARSLAHFCVAFNLDPTLKRRMKDEFLLAAAKHTAYLESKQAWKELFDCYQELLNANDECEELHHWLGTLLFRLDRVPEAVLSIRKALDLNPKYGAARASIDGIKTTLMERWHFPMLNDRSRNKAFQEAINEAVAHGHHQRVLDIGAGTGLLSLFALGAGAKEVYACEVSSVACDVARAVFELNGTRAKIINKHSTLLNIPEDIEQKVSLVVTETFDAGLFGEHVLPNLLHAWENLLDPQHPSGPKVIPEAAEVFLCLLECEHIRFHTSVKDTVLEALGMGQFEMRCPCVPYTTLCLQRAPQGYRMLSKPLRLLSVDFNDPEAMRNLLGKTWKETVECTEVGRLDCLGLWFRLRVGDTWLDTLHGDTCWEQAIYPVSGRLLRKGEPVHLDIKCSDHISIAEASPLATDRIRLELQEDIISILNESFTPFSEVAEVTDLPRGARILDISTVPILGLLFLKKDDTSQLTTIVGGTSPLVDAFLKRHNLRNRNKFASLDSLLDSKLPTFDVLVTDVWDASGNLRTSLFEYVAALRSGALKTNGVMLPTTCNVQAVLVESQTLEAESRVVSDEHTSGWQVASCLNDWAQVSSHQDICLSTIPHRVLCSPFQLFDVDLSRVQGTITAEQRVEITQSGFISACPYWFEAHYPSSRVNRNYGQGCHLLQAAVVLPKRISVLQGQYATVSASCQDGRLEIQLNVE